MRKAIKILKCILPEYTLNYKNCIYKEEKSACKYFHIMHTNRCIKLIWNKFLMNMCAVVIFLKIIFLRHDYDENCFQKYLII